MHDTSPALAPEAAAVAARPRPHFVMFSAIAAAAVTLDQVTKVLVRARLDRGETWPDGWELLRLTHVENSGAAFGILQGSGLFLLITSGFAIAAIALFFAWSGGASRLTSAALALVFGGAIGNLVDRATRGTVTDFIDPTHYPAFNVADSAIVVGVIALVVVTFVEPVAEEPAADETPGHGPDRSAP